VRKLYELHCAMEIEQLRVACDLMRKVENRDPESILPAQGFERALTFESNKAYVREILKTQTDLTSKDSDFVPVSTSPRRTAISPISAGSTTRGRRPRT
jgi:hypothetical protein